MEDISKYYEILGLKIGATLPQVKEAYKDLVKVWHPDRFVNDPALQEKAHRKISEINSAFSKIQEFLAHLDAYQQAVGGQQQTTTNSSPRPGDPQNVPPSGERVRSSPPAPDSDRHEKNTAINRASLLPLAFLVFAFIGNYSYLYMRDNLHLHALNVKALLYLCGQVLGMTILAIIPTLIYYKTRTKRARSWAVGFSILQILIALLAIADSTNETSRQSQPAPVTSRDKQEQTQRASDPSIPVSRDLFVEEVRRRYEAGTISKKEAVAMLTLNEAEKGDPQAQNKIGNIYYDGDGIPKNYIEAAKWYRKAADQGNAEAQYNLGRMHQSAAIVWDGGPQNNQEAAVFHLSVSENVAEAETWFRKAAEQGHAKAQGAIKELK